MTAPGSVVTRRSAALPRQAPVATGVKFDVGMTEKGPLTPQALLSMDDYAAVFGARVTWSYLYDALEASFKDGVTKAVICRAVGPTPVLATHTFVDVVPAGSLIITADSYGTWGNGLSVVITHPDGTHYVLAISLNGTLVETTPSFTTQQQAVDWSAGSDYVTIAAGVGSGIPVAATSSLAGGTDDHADITDAQYLTALNLLTKDLGPGQVCVSGVTTATTHANLFAHAAATNRVPMPDFADSGSKATLVTAAGVDRAVNGANTAGAFSPWAIIPGVTAGTTRVVPYSAVQCGIIARNDNAGVVPNQPSAGLTYGQSNYALGLTQAPWSDSDRGALNDAGVNVARILGGKVTTFGYRTLADPAADPEDILFSNARQTMAIAAQGQAILDGYVFRMIDGRGHVFVDVKGDLASMMKAWWTADALYGLTDQDAFTVDVGPNVNTADTISALQLRALLSYTLSPFAERTELLLVSTAVTEGV